MPELSVLIPARNEMFLKNTIEDACAHMEADTEVIATLDGAWADPPLVQHERVNVIYVPEAIGQRAATNIACRASKAKYIMKADAHCSFAQGFDRIMLEGFKQTGDDVVAVPIMKNLWGFDWKCHKCGKKWYQGPKPQECDQCKASGEKIRMKMMWQAKRRPNSDSYCFDAEPHFQYFTDYRNRKEYQDDLPSGFTRSMSLQGSCFMATREKYWELKLCDEALGNWGNQGIEVACKAWLSGMEVLCNHNTHYAHLFRTTGGFAFPWAISARDVQKTKRNVKNLLWSGKWDRQVRSIRWLLDKFWPVPGWTEEQRALLC